MLVSRDETLVRGFQGAMQNAPWLWGCQGSTAAPLTGGCRRPNALRVLNRRNGSCGGTWLNARISPPAGGIQQGAQRAPLARCSELPIVALQQLVVHCTSCVS